jgi:hypothetical protein
MPSRRMLLVFPVLLALTLGSPPPATAAEQEEWNFKVLLDGSPIGTQTFRRRREGNRSKISIEAAMDVKFLFVTAYTYRHRNEEVWEGSCLASIDATTDDNGKAFRVKGAATPDGFVVETGEGSEKLAPCIDSFAYWAPEELRTSQRLLNSQTGKFEAVQLLELGTESVRFRGQETPARRLALTGDKLRIDLWYTESDDWIALESTTTSGRKLYYERQ